MDFNGTGSHKDVSTSALKNTARLFVMALIMVISAGWQTVFAQSTTLTFNPTHDSWVSNTDSTSHGGDSQLRVRTAGQIERTFLKFQVSGLIGVVESAKVRLVVFDGSVDAGSIYTVSNNLDGTSTPWTETSLRFTNAPVISGAALDTKGVATDSAIVEFDVTPAITGNGTFSFGVQNNNTDEIRYFSKEGEVVPELVIVRQPSAVPIVSSFTPITAQVGGTVTITGSNFINITGVQFNGTAAFTFTVNSANQITATVPVGATTGKIGVTNDGGTGLSVNDFTVLPPTPIVSSFTPVIAQVGSVITITGSNFVSVASVQFNGAEASTFTVNSTTEIVATVPPGASNGKISVANTGGTGISANDFTVLPATPVISSFAPTGAQVGAPVIITGSNFVNVTGVQFNGTTATAFTVNSATQITATLPTGATTGKISVTNTGGTGQSATDFTVLPPTPVVSSFTPASAQAGVQATITGSNFVSVTGVQFNGTAASIFTVNSATEIVATVPAAATTGKISVVNTGGTGQSATDFTVLPPTPVVSSFTPTSGQVGAQVTVTGIGFVSITSMELNGTAVSTFTVNSPTEIVATVPVGATTGKISVTNASGTAISANDFTVLPPTPVVSSFTPANGAVGTDVTITGSNFVSVSGVQFNGIAASTFTVNSETELTATVPAGATTGKISVTNAGGTGQSATDFTVGPIISSFSPAGGPEGSEVTITGFNFTGATSVLFNGLAAATYTVDSATQISATVPIGATTGLLSVTTPSGTGSSASPFLIAPKITSFTPSSGAVGTMVTITGTSLTGATSVQFNATAASVFTINSATEIVATVPTGATTGKISVTTIGGTAESSADFILSPIISSFTPAGGSDATVVTITGNHFTGASSVQFNGAEAASFAVNSATQIQATVPAGATTGKISVTTAGGTAQSIDDFIIAPILTSFTPTSGPVNTEVTITGDNFTGASAILFNGTNASIFIIDSATQIRANVPAGATTGKISVTNIGGTAESSADFILSPIISSFTPAGGSDATVVTITGNHFTGASSVQFNGAEAASFAVNSATQIQATVPAGTTTGKISVTTAGGTAQSNDDFVIAPIVTSFTPVSGPVNTEVTISGNNFTGTSAILFNGTNASIFTVDSATQIRANVPSGATTGKISVTNVGGTAQSAADFTVLGPLITSFSPAAAVVGAEVTLTGSYFTGASNVKFNTTTATTFTVDSDTQIRANVPAGASTGKISVTTGGGTALSADDFTVIPPPPTISSFFPLTGSVGTEVTINGTNFVNVNSVQFNGASAAAFTVVSATQIKVEVPADATTGKIGVSTLGGSAQSLGDFFVTPVITSFTPASGPVGTEVTITGANFTGTTSVKFNGVSGFFLVDSSTQVRATVPAGATSGKISVTTAGGATALSATDFILPPLISSFTPASGITGTEVTITGNHFTGATALEFNGAAASTFTVDSATQIRATVPASASTGKIGVTTAGGTVLSANDFTHLAPTITSFTPPTGLVGAEVTITGANFIGASSVQFNGTEATTFTVDSPTQIRADVPAGATTGKISVTTGGGTALSVDDFIMTPVISSFSPANGLSGTEVTVTGSHFIGATDVLFNGVTASFTVDSNTQIRSTVPVGASSGKISVTTLGGTALSATDFSVLASAITSFTPTTGTVGTEVTITGANFAGIISVEFNGTAASVFTVDSPTQIRATVPSGATTGKIGVTTGAGTALSTIDFTMTPSIASFTPAFGAVGAEVTITGDHLTGATSVDFNGTVATTFTVDSNTQIRATVPDGATSGKINVTTAGGTASSATDFFMIPIISSFTPTAGLVGTEVTITGSHFGGATSVQFNGVAASSFAVDSPTQIRAIAPAAATNGKISVTTPGGAALSDTDFLFNAPAIASFTPTNGFVGTEVTITGGNLSGASSVTFNGAEASTFTVDSATQIRATIAAGTTTGKINVTTGGGTAVSTEDFVMTAIIASFTPASGVAGTEVTISGSHFTGATAVTFNTAPASSFTVDSATQIRATVAPSTTTGKISVTTPGGEAFSASDFTIPPPSIVSFTPFSGAIGVEVTIIGNNFTGATDVQFNGTSASAFTVDSNAQIRATVPTGATTGKISVNTPGGSGLSANNFIVAPIISSFTPASAVVNTEITITGSNFIGATSVKFNGTSALFIVDSETQIKAVLPSDATSGKISVTNVGGTALSTDDFLVTPIISSFTPTSGPLGAEVTITGTGLTGATAVQFNGTAASAFTVDSPTQIRATIATGSTTGKISVTTTGGIALSATDFTIAGPSIASFAPASGPVTTEITITGTNFVFVSGVTFNGTAAATFTVDSPTQIRATVAAGATTGKVSVITGGGTVLSADDFTVLGPVITSFTPTSSLVGVEVTITGSNFVDVNSVSFNGTPATTFTVDSATQIRANVPAGATSGKISVETGGGTAQSAADFTVIPPVPIVASFTPASGLVGIEVTITGSNFSNATDVQFNGASASTFTVDSDTQIRVTAPVDATTGKISVTTLGGTGLSASDFAVGPVITSFTPTSAVVGAEITITGNNFNGATSVKFNGVGALFIVDSATAIRTTVPSSASSGKISVTTAVGTMLSATDFLVTPAISSFTPASATVGTQVTITGTGLTGATAVQFNGLAASTFTVSSSTQILATVANGSTTGKISVITAGGTAQSSIDFTVLGPAIASFTPASGLVGVEVTITGSNFVSVTSVSFDDTLASIFTVDSATQIRANVPVNATTGKISVITGGGTALSAANFTVIPPAPVITSFTPATGVAGDEVTLTGDHFAGATAVQFNGTAASSFTIDSATQIRATLSANATSGKISVTTAGGTALSATDFTVTSPSISSFTPAAGVVGSEVTIIGGSLTGASSVEFNGVSASTFTVDSNTQIRATVPNGATTGKISVTTVGGTAQSSTDFTVLGPAIASFTPTSGLVGVEVTITGSNFVAVSGVSFNGAVALTFTVDSATQIRANVPVDATTGKISVNTGGGTALSASDFTVIPPAPVISSFTPASGLVGVEATITGSNFAGAAAVQFNGTAASSFTVDSATQIRATLPVGATSGKISVTTSGGTGQSATDFTVLAPTIASFSPASGLVGIEVTITGSNFTGASAVDFNGTAAAVFTVDSATQIRATVPIAATTGKIGVTTGGGTALSSNDFTVIPPAPAITSFTPASGPAGVEVTITGNNFTGASSVLFNGAAATIFTVDSDVQIRAQVPASGTSGKISVTTAGGTALSASDFTVSSPSIASFNPVIGLIGSEVTITGSSLTGAANVQFNGVTAPTFTVDSSTQIRATIPVGATTGKISVTTGGGTALSAGDFTVTAGGTSTTTSVPLYDAYVRLNTATSNYGNVSVLRMRQGGGDKLRSFLKFVVAGVSGTVTKATLRMRVTDESVDGGSVYSVSNNYNGTSTPWTQEGIIWNNAPSIDGSPLSSTGAVSVNQIVEFDVTGGVTGNGNVSFGMLSEASDLVQYSPQEGPTKPELIVEFGTGSLPSPSISSFTPSSGAVGVEVTISGANFIGASSVKFNGVSASTFTVDSNTQLRTNVPVGATTGAISVTTGGGTATSGSNFTVTTPPATPSITSFTPSSGVTGTEVTVTGTNLNGATSVQFNSVSATSFTVDSNTQLRATVPGGATTGKISVTTPGGTALSATDFTVTVPASPSIASFTPASGLVGSEVTISGTNFTGATNVQFNGVSASVFTVDSGTQIRATVPAGATTGKIGVTTGGGSTLSAGDFTITTGGTETTTSVPLYDAYVRLKTATSNYGNVSVLRMRQGGGDKLRSFLKFVVTGVSGTVTKATLRMQVTDESNDGGSVYSVSNNYNGTSTPWTQEGINWNNAPSIDGSPLSSTGAVSNNQIVEFDVTGGVTGNGNVSFGMLSEVSDLVQYSPQEGPTKPELIVEFGTGSLPSPSISSFTPSSGVVGAEVTISGANFIGASSVKFNGVSASTFTVDSNTQLRANVPVGATTGAISVTTGGGTATSGSNFTVTTPPATPTITSFTPSSGVTGTEVTVTGTNLNGATNVQFNSVSSSTFTVDSNTQLRATVPGGATTGKISVTTPGGTALSATDFTVTVPASPSIASFTPASGLVGSEVTISGTNFTGATNVQFNGISASTFTVDSGTQIRANVPAGATTGKIGVTTGGGSALSAGDFTVTTGGGSTFTERIVPLYDSYVRLSTATSNFGNTSTLRLRKSGGDDLDTYLKFVVTNVNGSVVSAKLRLEVTNDGNDGGEVYAVSNFYKNTTTLWTESGVNWNNAPVISGSPLSAVGPVAVGQIAEFDVTAAITGNGTFSFGLSNSSSNDVYYSSQEGSTKPELLIEYSTGGGPAAPTISSFTPTSGLIGTEVTVAGANFSGASSVKFNGVAASSFTIDSGTQIRANVPSGATTGKVSVTTGGGTATSTGDFTVTTPASPPTVAAFSPASGIIGVEVTIIGTNFTGATSVQFAGVTANAYTVDSATQIRANVPGGTVTGKISVTTPGGVAQSATDFTVTGGGSVTLTFNPFEDSYVQKSNPTGNFGSDNRLRVRKTSSEQMITYLKFSPSGISGTIISATLRIKVMNDSDDGGTVYKVSNDYRGTSTSWTEGGINWNNAPTISGSALSSVGAAGVGDVMEFDVTAALTGNGAISFAIDNGSSNDVHYYSHESAVDPELVVVISSPSFAREDGFADSQTEALPTEYSLSQNYPNPFNAGTTIEYALPEDVQVRLVIYNSLGQIVRKLVDESQSAGYKSVTWNGTDDDGRAVGSGLYFYRLDAGGRRMNSRMILQQ